jgi:hypothetical protein
MREFGFRDQSSTWLAIEWGDAEACSAEVTPRDGMIVFLRLVTCAMVSVMDYLTIILSEA